MSLKRAGRAVVLLFVVAFAPRLGAQTAMGTITGLVTDTSGAVIPSAGVVARNIETGVQARTVTSTTGNYVIPNLVVGQYELTIASSGFKTWVRTGILLSSSESARVDAVLEVGAITERIEVRAEAPSLRTESTEVSTTMEQKLVADLPLAASGVGGGMRNVYSLMMMMPQVTSSNGQSAGDDFKVGGGQLVEFNVSVDGLSVELGWRNMVSWQNRLVPVVDAVQEFRDDTAAFKAEESRASGGLLVVVTKSGTNQLHASAFDFYQSQRLDANTWLNNKLGRAIPIYHRNDFGGTVSGPIFVPHLYNGKNRSYFLFSYEGYRWPQTSGVNQLTIPTPAMIQGDFSGWKKTNGSLIPIFDPFSTTINADGKVVRDAFAGNIIPPNLLSPVSKNIAKYFPAPNAPGLVRNYNTAGNAPKKRIENAFVVKLDHAFGMANRLALTWTRNYYWWDNAYDHDLLDPNNYSGLPYPLAGRLQTKGDQQYGNVLRLNDTHIITPTLVNTLTVGFHRLVVPQNDITMDQNWGDKLGGIKNNPGYNKHFPAVFFNNDNYQGWESSLINTEYNNIYAIEDSLVWIKSSHSFKFGYNYTQIQMNWPYDRYMAGNYYFDRRETSMPGDNTGNFGSSFASFMLGAVDNGFFSTGGATMRRWPSHAFYAQDDWKISPRLTVNVGFRFELFRPAYQKHDQISFFDPTLPNPAANGYPGAQRFLGFGQGREGKRTFYAAAVGYGPRAGLAFQLSPNTVLRGGFGIFSIPSRELIGGGLSLGQSPSPGFIAIPTFSSGDQGITPAFYWDHGWPAWAVPPSFDPSFSTGTSITWEQEKDLALSPSSTSWNAAISHAFPHNLVVDVTYTGTKGTHLASGRPNYMQIDPKYAYLGSLLNSPINSPAVVALGFKPPFPAFTQLMGSNATLGQSLRMFPQYTDVITGGQFNHSGNSTYHAALVKVTKRYSQGLSLLASYTWSKNLTDADSGDPWIAQNSGARIGYSTAQDNYNRRLEKSYSMLDQPHVLKVAASYESPFGRGKPLLTTGSAGRILGNWTMSGSVLAQAGFPLGVVDSGYNNFLRAEAASSSRMQTTVARPNVLTDQWKAPISGGTFDPGKDIYFSTSAFVRRTNPATDPIGNAPRFNGNTRSFPVLRENIALTRTFHISERATANVRWEVFDLFNHKTWGLPGMDLNNPQFFGIITTADGARTMQVGLRLAF